MVMPTYKLGITYGIFISTLHTASWILDTGAGFNDVHSRMIPLNLANCIKRKNMPQLRTATKQSLHCDGMILLQLRLGELSTRI